MAKTTVKSEVMVSSKALTKIMNRTSQKQVIVFGKDEQEVFNSNEVKKSEMTIEEAQEKYSYWIYKNIIKIK